MMLPNTLLGVRANEITNTRLLVNQFLANTNVTLGSV